MKARDLMTSDPFTVAPADKLSRAAELMRDIRVGCIPVVSKPGGSELVGIITDRDIAIRCVARAHGSSCLVRDHMTAAPLQTVTPDADVSDVVARMERAQVRRIPVVSDDGALLGVIAQADLATKLGPTEPLKVEEVLERISAATLVVA
jgi:CBS domain-containing protein